MKNISLFPILIVNKCNPRIAVWIVLDRYYLSRDRVLVAAEVNDPIQTLVSTTATATGNHATIIATLGAMLGLG
jgi:hypothetical protein